MTQKRSALKRDSSFIDHFDGFWKGVHYVHLDGKLFRVTRGGRRWTEVLPRKRSRRRRRKKPRLLHNRGYRIHGNTPRFRQSPISNEGLGSKIKGAVTIMGTYRTYTNGVLTASTNIKATGDGLFTQGWRQCWDRLNPGPPYHEGGEFKKIEYSLLQGHRSGYGEYTSSGNPNLVGSGLKFVYRGDFCCDSNWGVGNSIDFSRAKFSDFGSLSEFHTRAWDQLKPTLPKVNLAQFIYELRDLPRMLQTTGKEFARMYNIHTTGLRSRSLDPLQQSRRVADHFINQEFGWAPFITDLLGLYDLYQNSHRYVQETVRNNGQWLRRRRVFEATDTAVRTNRFYHSGTDPSSGSFQMEPLLKDMSIDGFTVKAYSDIWDHNTSQVWGVGSFRYYRPEFDDSLADFSSSFTTVQRLLTLYGLRINPATLYKITPWTWLIDWFTQFGSFIEAHDDFIIDGIVSRYLYVMKTTQRRLVKTCTFNWYNGPRTLAWQRSLTYKQREVADSPYGFNRPWTGLSAKQIGILAAIGISQSKGGFISRGA